MFRGMAAALISAALFGFLFTSGAVAGNCTAAKVTGATTCQVMLGHGTGGVAATALDAHQLFGQTGWTQVDRITPGEPEGYGGALFSDLASPTPAGQFEIEQKRNRLFALVVKEEAGLAAYLLDTPEGHWSVPAQGLTDPVPGKVTEVAIYKASAKLEAVPIPAGLLLVLTLSMAAYLVRTDRFKA